MRYEMKWDVIIKLVGGTHSGLRQTPPPHMVTAHHAMMCGHTGLLSKTQSVLIDVTRLINKMRMTQ